tara:strand:- start:446 stop:715 length:270 start_codon:yes stop_codon:yes gene_type:complete
MSFNSLIFRVFPFRLLDVVGRSSVPLVSGEASDVSLTGADALLVLFAIRKTELLDFGEVCCAEVSIAPAIIQILLNLEETQAQKSIWLI